MHNKSIHWFRRDLRLEDNRALYEACLNSNEVIPIFVFDTNILNKLKAKDDKRVTFIYETILELKNELLNLGKNFLILYGDPTIEIPKAAKKLNVNCVYTNKDYEPYAKSRDHTVEKILQKENIQFLSFKDHVIFEEKEILNASGSPYKVFTPYKNAWLKKLQPQHLSKFNPDLKKITQHSGLENKIIELANIGFKKATLIVKPGKVGAAEQLEQFSLKIKNYDINRNFIDLDGTSKISIYMRFGIISIRELFRYANSFPSKGADVWKSELIWREFYPMILSEFPHVENNTFKEEFNSITWSGKEEHFLKWCEGQTGYPIIDAAMRYFNETGWMHNRLRMIVASFLTKDLLIHYKKGEEYFAQKLLDFDLAANNGGWQWCASTGCDAQPYFRVFNPETQSKNFDPQGSFIKKHCPELSFFSEKYIHAPHTASEKEQNKAKCIIGINYPFPIVVHDKQRLKAIEMFKI
ncbi:MAG: deoxyribodipyrimidine photo-lyase [Bdellovibrionota bacterium]